MSNALVRKGFESRLSLWASSRAPAIPLVYENTPFDPPVDSQGVPLTYARMFHLPGQTTSLDLEGRSRSYRGVFQVTFVMPTGIGAGLGQRLEHELDVLFALNANFAQDGEIITLLTPMSAGVPDQEPDVYSLPVSCTYRCDIVSLTT